MIAQTEQIKKIDISKLKEAHIEGIVGDLIQSQSTSIDIDEFLNFEKTLEQILKHKED